MNEESVVKPAIIVFPGSNCERDMAFSLHDAFDLEPVFLWHTTKTIPPEITHVIIPGGFSYGDYVRAGAIAVFSPIMGAVKEFASQKGRVLGVCNGFQILCEAGLLPGLLLKNTQHRFVCEVQTVSWFGMRRSEQPQVLKLPIAHGEGRYFATDDEIDRLIRLGLVAMTYCQSDEHGDALVNGSRASIAGIIGGNNRNILGLMPHPERATEEHILGTDGRIILQEFLFG